jgi:CheY-like chemotaxis protein
MKPRYILVLDDDPNVVELLTEVFSEEGYSVVGHHWLADAADQINADAPNLDLVILDLHLPRRGEGFQLYQQLQSDPYTASIPVILYSADSRALNALAPHITAPHHVLLQKPFDLNDLLNLTHDLLASAPERNSTLRSKSAGVLRWLNPQNWFAS